MAMKRCPICGERYSDTYKDCPFCEEEEAYQDGAEIRRNVSRGGRRVAGRQKMSLLTPTLIVLIIIMAGLLVYLLWGDQIGGKKGGEETTTPPTSSVAPGTTVTPVKPEESEQSQQPTVTPDTEEEPPEVEPENQPAEGVAQTEYDKVNMLPNGLVVSNEDFTLNLLGESHTVRVSGGSGTYTWVSEDDGIASVDSNGKITAVSGGTVNVLVTDGSKKGVVIVRVKASGSLPEAPATSEAGSGGAHKLNREDITLKVGEKFQLKLTGVTTAPVWNSSKPGVVSVSGDGTVTGVASGTSTVTVSWDGGSLSCIVRVK